MIGSGNALSVYSEFIDLTGPYIYSGPQEVINDAQKTNFGTMGWLLRGQDMARILQGGSEVRDYIYLSAVRRARSYKLQQRQVPQVVETGTMWTVPWRFGITDMSWPEEIIDLNTGGMDGESKFHQYKDLFWRMKQQLHTDLVNYIEDTCWAVPNRLEMEAADGQEIYSIPSLVNEHTAGLPTAVFPGGAWTTKQAINPTDPDKLNWRPQQFGYGANNAGFSATEPTNVVRTLDRAFNLLDFKPPPIMQGNYFEGIQNPVGVIMASNTGLTALMQLYRDSNDRWPNFSDPHFVPTYRGTPIVYVRQKDTAAVYPTGTSDGPGREQDTGGTTNQGPRFELIHPEYLGFCFHKDRFFKPKGVMTDVEMPTTHVKYYLWTWQLKARSLARQGILFPTSDQNTLVYPS